MLPQKYINFNYLFTRIVSNHCESSLIVIIHRVKVQMLAEIPATTTGVESMATRVTDPGPCYGILSEKPKAINTCEFAP